MATDCGGAGSRMTRPRDARGSAAPATRRLGAQRGQALVLFVVMMPLFFAIIGLTIDGGIVWAARREAQNLADSTARAGADQLDVAQYRATNGASVQVDPSLARLVAASFLEGEPFDWKVDATPQGVTVTVGRDVPLSFMKLFGFRRVRIGAVSSARPLFGITEGRP